MKVVILQAEGATWDNNLIVIPAEFKEAFFYELKGRWIHADFSYKIMEEEELPTEGKFRDSWKYHKEWFEKHKDELKPMRTYISQNLTWVCGIEKAQSNNRNRELSEHEKSFIERVMNKNEENLKASNSCEAMYMDN